MLTALVLICSILATPDLRDCDETNARVVMLVPEAFANPVTCAMHGQAYLAGTAVGRNLVESDRIKIVCRRRTPSTPPIAKGKEPDEIQDQRARLRPRETPDACDRPTC